MVVKDRRLAAAANPLVAGFFALVARIFQRRIHARRRGQRKILDRSESAGTPRETGRSARSACRAVAEAGGVKAGLLINATRVAIVGQAVAPPLFDTMVVLGQQRVVRRLRDAVASFAKASL